MCGEIGVCGDQNAYYWTCGVAAVGGWDDDLGDGGGVEGSGDDAYRDRGAIGVAFDGHSVCAAVSGGADYLGACGLRGIYRGRLRCGDGVCEYLSRAVVVWRWGHQVAHLGARCRPGDVGVGYVAQSVGGDCEVECDEVVAGGG